MHLGALLSVVLTSFGTFGLLLAPSTLWAQSKSVIPQGQFAEIDTRLANETIAILSKGSAADQQSAIQRIKESPQDFAPPVFYALSHVLFERGDKDEAAFWFYAGQLRGRFDANLCTDSSARQAIAVLNQKYGRPINQYMFQDVPKLEALIPRIVEWDRRTPYNYDHRWINLHGMNAVMSGLDDKPHVEAPSAMSAPKEQWEDIAEKTRTDYLSGFNQALAQMKSRSK
jgi:hypothetical protein